MGGAFAAVNAAKDWVLGLALLFVNPPVSMTLGEASYPDNLNDTLIYPVTSSALVSEVCSNAGEAVYC